MTKPAVLLVPGSFGLPEFYDNIVSPVAAKGYDIRALHYPSVGLSRDTPREGPGPTMYDDAAFITNEVEKLADEGKNVILIAHSYGGIPMTESMKGVTKKEREREGKAGGVVRLAYITALVPAVGIDATGLMGEVPEEYKLDFRFDKTGWMYHQDLPRAAAICFSDIPKEDAEAWMTKFPPHSAISFTNPLTYAGYKNTPVSYLVCENDICVLPEMQRGGIDLIEKESGKMVEVTSIKTGHIPMASEPQMVVDWILKVAGTA